MTRYARAPSPQLEALLAPGGLLAPLLAPMEAGGLPLDPQLREKEHVHLYCGLTRLVDAWPGRGGIKVSAHKTYRSQPGTGRLYRTWRPGEQGFAEALGSTLAGLRISPSHLRREGAVQAAWAQVTAPWVPFDREAVVGYGSSATQQDGRAFPAVEQARAELASMAEAEGWAAPPEGKVGAELDQLAIDARGRLVLIELKHGGASASSVYYAALQLLQYAHEWAAVVDRLRPELEALIAARVRLGMSPLGLPALSGGLRPVVGFGEDLRSAEVRRRSIQVRAVVDRHLPPGVGPVEVWALVAGSPRRLG